MINRHRPYWRSRLDPVRTCLGCRLRTDKSSLLRVVARDGEVVADPSATLPGRGGWVHPTRECVETAIKRKAFGRALKVGSALDTAQVLALAVAYRQGSRPTSRDEMAENTMDN